MEDRRTADGLIGSSIQGHGTTLLRECSMVDPASGERDTVVTCRGIQSTSVNSQGAVQLQRGSKCIDAASCVWISCRPPLDFARGECAVVDTDIVEEAVERGGCWIFTNPEC